MKFDISSVAALTRSNGLRAFTDVIKEIGDVTLPILTNYEALLKKDKVAMQIATESNRALGGAPNKPWPTAVIAVLEAHVARENEVEDLIGEVVPKNVEVESIDSRSVQVAQYIDTLTFFSNFTRRLVIMETDLAAKKRGLNLTQVQSPGEVKDVIQGFPGYRIAFNQLRQQMTQDVVKLVKETPDYVVSAADLEALNATYGSAKANPLAQGFISADWNPIFKLREVFANRLIKRYHVAKEQRQNLEYKIQVLTQDIEDHGKKNPQLEQELEYHTRQLKRLTNELEKIEERTR